MKLHCNLRKAYWAIIKHADNIGNSADGGRGDSFIIMTPLVFRVTSLQLCSNHYRIIKAERSVRACWIRVRVDVSDWFGAPLSATAASVSAVNALSCAGAAAAAKSHGIGEDGVGVDGAARQDGGAVLHLVVGAARLKRHTQEPLVAILFTHTHTNIVINCPLANK